MKDKDGRNLRPNRIVDLIFAPFCCICGDRAADSRMPFCDECVKKLQISLVKECPVCGAKRNNCRCEKHGNAVFLFYYHEQYEKRAVLNLKKSPDKRVASFFGRLLAEKVKREKTLGFDCVTYVPRKPKNIRAYGGDQGKMIASGVAEGLGIPLCTLLKRKKSSGTDQKLLDAVERRKNVKNLFEAANPSADFHRVLLIDDVTTTGATIDECADILRKAGVDQVVKAVLAKTP
jgi:ComF family protein